VADKQEHNVSDKLEHNCHVGTRDSTSNIPNSHCERSEAISSAVGEAMTIK